MERLTKQLTQLKGELEVATEAERKARHNAQDQTSKDSERVRLAEKKVEEVCLRERGVVEPVVEKQRKFATHVWTAVARVLGFQGRDLHRITKAAKHMHDTKSSNWKESVANNTELVMRLRSAGKMLMTSLFTCVRTKRNTVPVEQVVQAIFSIGDDDANGGNALAEIRKAVRSAVSERRMSEAKVLLTLAISSFGNKGGKLESMKKYFSRIEPIRVGCKVTFLTPDNSPIKSVKKIECRNYSYLSKAVTRGTVVSVMSDGKSIKVRHHVPGWMHVCLC